MSTLSESHNHRLSLPSLPIVATTADFDPLLSPPQHYHKFPNPNSPDSSSYNDVVFSPSNGGDTPTWNYDALSLSRSPSSRSGYLKITVSNPIKEQENFSSIVSGSSSYVTYLITTRTNISEFGGSEFGVRRRFRDIATLSDRLAKAYRGFFIPPGLDKSIVESHVTQKQEFMEQRRVALEKCRYSLLLFVEQVMQKQEFVEQRNSQNNTDIQRYVV